MTAPRRTNDQWYTCRLLQSAVLAPHAVIAEMKPVIAPQNIVVLLVRSEVFEFVQQHADLGVDERRAGVVTMDRFTLQILAMGSPDSGTPS